jgi:pimeloyl-ACP methyl ester carboxylesterase
MDSHLLKKASFRLPALADLAVLRFNTRGTTSPRGTSQGAFDGADGEKFDVAAALDLCEAEDLPSIWLLGWSFGTDLALKYGCDPSVVGAVLISPPLRFSAPADLQQWADSGKPLTRSCPSTTTSCSRPRPASASPSSRRPRWSTSRRQAPVRRLHRDRARRGGPAGRPAAHPLPRTYEETQ